MRTLTILPIPGIPLVQPGQDPGLLLSRALQAGGLTLGDDDILVIAQKIISKAEGRRVRLDGVVPSPCARSLAESTGKDPRQVEVILWDTAEVVRAAPGVLIVEHRLGFISANAGVDRSNVGPAEEETLLRLPADPDASARALRARLEESLGVRPPVLIIDSHGRPWRLGTAGVAIGLAGLNPLQDLRGRPDLFGVPLEHTDVGFADQVAAAASLVMGQAAEGCPAAIVRGLPFEADDQATARDILRPKAKDLFR